MKALVVDDVLYMRRILSDKLVKLGYEVEEAESGEEAVSKLGKVCPDIVFMDVVMPGMDGITATKLIKQQFDGKIIICSALSDKLRIFDALQAGANKYIVKPFDDSQLRSVIEE